ncbi:MAG: hypothetical protein JWO59_1190, partial [Chloroflexi bacterium]|nr:hypothetical protein [Chloroflexota bacterium]
VIPPKSTRVTVPAIAAANPARHAGRRRLWPILVGAFLGLCVVAVAGWIVLFPSATVTITYSDLPFDRTYRAAIGTGGIALHHGHLVQSMSRIVPGTGTRLVPDKHATGTITYANQLNGSVFVPAGTIVDSQSGTRFATTQDIRVPGAVHSFAGTSNGQASVPVQAIAGGEASNIGAGTIVSIEGRLAGALLVTNYAAMAGGTMRTVYSLTSADIAAPEAQLRGLLATSEIDTLNKRYAKSPVREIGPQRSLQTQFDKLVQHGRPYARVTVSMRTDISYIHQEDVAALAASKRQADIAGSNLVVVPGTAAMTVTQQRTGSLTALFIHVTARTAPVIDTANLRALLTSRSVAEARQLLDGSARNGRWRYSLKTSPDWAHRFPVARELITIRVVRAG